MNAEVIFSISFTNFRRLVDLHSGTINTVNVIENADYQYNLTKTRLETNFTNSAGASYIVIEK